MDTSTIVVVFLLVTAASLASYALSHWSSVRGAIGVGWAATSLGTTMLLLAAAVVVLTFVFRGPLWRPHFGAEQPMREPAAAPEATSRRTREASLAPLEAADASRATSSPTALPPISRRRPYDYDPSAAPAGEKSQVSKVASTTPDPFMLGTAPAAAFRQDDPWAATGCVHVFHPGSDRTEWKIENECNLPVGVNVSGCDSGTRNCGLLVFPAKLQRPIPLEEQIVYGSDIHYVACLATTSSVIYLMGAPSEERATDTWREQFEAARASDGCLH